MIKTARTVQPTELNHTTEQGEGGQQEFSILVTSRQQLSLAEVTLSPPSTEKIQEVMRVQTATVFREDTTAQKELLRFGC